MTEDINNIMNLSEVPNIMLPEDWDEIFQELSFKVKGEKIDTRAKLKVFFNENIKKNLHLILAYQPQGEKFRRFC
jgi:hypothetical protein